MSYDSISLQHIALHCTALHCITLNCIRVHCRNYLIVIWAIKETLHVLLTEKVISFEMKINWLEGLINCLNSNPCTWKKHQ